MSDAFFAAVDWGTTRLRLWLLDRDGTVLAERRSDDGMLVAGQEGFSTVLERHLDALGAPKTLPAILCGMVGSRQGWVEAPYVDLPMDIDAPLTRAIALSETRRPVWIVPGAAQRDPTAPDVMRGEETQIAGALALDPAAAMLCLPGTHCKWASVDRGRLMGFRTFMTGELFAVLAGHSILRLSLPAERSRIGPEDEIFTEWCRRGIDAPQDAIGRLFSVRASSLLFDLQPQPAEAALSGLLIGAEVGAMRGLIDGTVTLIASGGLTDLYRQALALADIAVTVVDAETAVREGLMRAAKALLA